MPPVPARVVFDVLLGLHVTCALVGFGSVALTGVYGFLVSGGVAEDDVRRYFASPSRLEWLLLVVPLFGLGALLADPHGHGLLQLWPGLAALVWLVASGLLLGLVRPAERSLRAGGPRLDPSVGRRLGWAGVGADVAFFVALMLMIWQPR